MHHPWPFQRGHLPPHTCSAFHNRATKRISKVRQVEVWKSYISQEGRQTATPKSQPFHIRVLEPWEQSLIFGFGARRLAQFTDRSAHGLHVCACVCECGIRRLRDMLWKQVLFISQEGGWVVWGLWLLSWSTATGKLKSFPLYLA